MIAELTAQLDATGDDCAVLPLNDSRYDLVLTSDPLIEGVHFTKTAAPEQIGHKAVARVLSDFAAMGADPQYLLINLVAPPDQNVRFLKKIYTGIFTLCKSFNTKVVGGDLARGKILEIHVFGVGRVAKGDALLRSGACVEDILYVTGPLGGSLKNNRHLTFTPRISEGKWLRQTGRVSSMIDLSDGLATDLRHILRASGVGANLNSAKIPKIGTLEQALFDGEDFELLFTVRAQEIDLFDSQCTNNSKHTFSKIGTITDRPEILTLDGVPIEGNAFDHFS